MDPEGLLLPEGTRLLHIGPPKTGSTAIQAALRAARPRLAEHGVCYPGSRHRARRPGWAVLGWNSRWRPNVPIEEWYAFVEEVRAAGEQRVCISTEDFGRASKTQAARIVEDLGGERVHVVAVARRLDKFLPSQWQERVKHAEHRSYEEWLHHILGDPPGKRAANTFWASQTHNIVRIAERWVAAVGEDRFTLVVSDESDRAALPRTFERMLGLPQDMLRLNSNSNTSLSMNGTELVRRLNLTFAERGWTDTTYSDLILQGLVPGMQRAARTSRDRRIPPLPAWAAERVAQLSAQRVADLDALGCRVVGDPKNLLVDPEFADVEDYSAEDISVELALRAVEGTVERAVARQDKLRAVQAERSAAARRTVDNTGSRDLLRVVAGRVAGRVRRG